MGRRNASPDVIYFYMALVSSNSNNVLSLRQMDRSADEIRPWGFTTQRIIKRWVDERWRVRVVR